MARPAVRRAFVAVVALLAAAAGAGWYLTAGPGEGGAVGAGAGPGAARGEAAGEAPAVRDASADRAPRPRRRAAAAETDAADADAQENGAPGAVPGPPGGTAAPAPPGAGDVAEWVAQAMVQAGVPASPDRDPATGEAPAVAPGRPPELALATYAERGAAAVGRAAALVGDRRPVVEEGVPVALSGRVVEAEGGAPIAGARLVVSSTFYVRRYFYDHHLTEVASAESAADGTWAIERLNVDPAHFGSGGRLYLTVTAPERAPALAVPLASVTPGVANRLRDVALRRATQTLRGRVTDLWEGRPVAGVRVVATGHVSPVSYPKDERPALFVGAPAAVTDADGRFVLAGLCDGPQTISAHAGDDCIGWTVVALPHEGEFELRARQVRGRIAGTCVDARGEPIDVVMVACDDNSTHSFADGRFALENFRGDAVTVRFTHPDYADVTLPAVADGTAGLVVRMERQPAEVVLDVRARETGAPLRRVAVEFGFADGRDRPARTSPQRVAADGRHRVRIPPGATTATISAAGRDPETVPLAAPAPVPASGDVIVVLLAAPGAGR